MERADVRTGTGRGALAALLAVSLPAPAGAAGFQGLGDLAGGTFNSGAYAVSADGPADVTEAMSQHIPVPGLEIVSVHDPAIHDQGPTP